MGFLLEINVRFSSFKRCEGVNALQMLQVMISHTAFPQWKEISFQMTITFGGGVSINCIYYSIFSTRLCVSSFVKLPPPIMPAICKYIVETLIS